MIREKTGPKVGDREKQIFLDRQIMTELKNMNFD